MGWWPRPGPAPARRTPALVRPIRSLRDLALPAALEAVAGFSGPPEDRIEPEARPVRERLRDLIGEREAGRDRDIAVTGRRDGHGGSGRAAA